jgi:hypothetical protein
MSTTNDVEAESSVAGTVVIFDITLTAPLSADDALAIDN